MTTIIINPTDVATIASAIGRPAHFANGTYAMPQSVYALTTMAGFQYVISQDHGSNAPLVVAINSDVSMELLNSLKQEKGEAAQPYATQVERAKQVVEILEAQFRRRDKLICFYNEETPKELYDHLGALGLMRSLHKHGYGTTPDAPIIVGTNCADKTYGFVLPNDIKPVAHGITASGSNADVTPVDMRDTLYQNKSWLTPEAKELLDSLSGPATGTAPVPPGKPSGPR